MEKQKVINKFVLMIAMVAIALSAYFYYQWNFLKQNPQAAAQLEVNDWVEKVSRLIVLPVGETPSLATVSDPEVLKDQIFFVGASKGDIVLIYTTAKKAILYDPVLNKIVNVAPLNIGEDKVVTAPVTKTAPAPEEVKVVAAPETKTVPVPEEKN